MNQYLLEAMEKAYLEAIQKAAEAKDFDALEEIISHKKRQLPSGDRRVSP